MSSGSGNPAQELPDILLSTSVYIQSQICKRLEKREANFTDSMQQKGEETVHGIQFLVLEFFRIRSLRKLLWRQNLGLVLQHALAWIQQDNPVFSKVPLALQINIHPKQEQSVFVFH